MSADREEKRMGQFIKFTSPSKSIVNNNNDDDDDKFIETEDEVEKTIEEKEEERLARRWLGEVAPQSKLGYPTSPQTKNYSPQKNSASSPNSPLAGKQLYAIRRTSFGKTNSATRALITGETEEQMIARRRREMDEQVFKKEQDHHLWSPEKQRHSLLQKELEQSLNCCNNAPNGEINAADEILLVPRTDFKKAKGFSSNSSPISTLHNKNNNKQVIDNWNVDNVCNWLEGIGLEESKVSFCQQIFRDNDINGRALKTLTKEELQEIGVVSLGLNKIILSEIKLLQ